jgi:hypothetical protein
MKVEMTGHKVTPSMINKLGASNSQAMRASCCRKVGRRLIKFISMIEKMSGFAFSRKPTHDLRYA